MENSDPCNINQEVSIKMKRKTIAFALVAGAIITLLVLGYGGIVLYFSWPITLGNVDKAGVFGDSFGILTALFSGLAFAGIILTVWFQSQELQLQRQELSETRIEIRNQNATLQKQSFESTFFQMVRLYNDIVNSMREAEHGELFLGRACFINFYEYLRGCYTSKKNQFPGREEMEYIENYAYPGFWSKEQSKLGHYFRHLYTIFKFIKTSDVKDKRLYSNIVRAQLSDYELLILFYNCLAQYGKEKFKPLAEEFALFDNLPLELLIKREHQSFYSQEAFGNKDI